MRKQTKIVATISEATGEIDILRQLHEAGMDAIRINTAHQSVEGLRIIIENLKKVSDKIPLILDTKGPEIRVTKVEEGISVKKGERIIIKGDPNGISTKECIYVTYENFVNDLAVGSRILIDDGEVEFVVLEKDEDKLVCEVKNDGIIRGRTSINVPDVRHNLPSLSQKDRDYIYFAIDNGIEFIAHSFVRNKDDVLAIQNILDEKQSPIKLIAKIENQAGVENIDEIMDHVYGVMIARGDLGIEMAEEKIPGIQKMIIRKCVKRKKPVIVATQMLHSMIKNPRPTRAEVSDVANAVYDGTDAVMLSGETSYGAYPIEAVRTMAKIALEVEASVVIEIPVEPIDNDIAAFLARAAVRASVQLSTKAIIADTITGRTARYLAACRGKNPVYSQCYDKRVMRELALSYGVYADYRERRKSTDKFIQKTLNSLLENNCFGDDDLVLVLAGSYGPSNGASFIEISTVKNMLGRG